MFNKAIQGFKNAVSELMDNASIVKDTVFEINERGSVTSADVSKMAGAGISIIGIASLLGVATHVVEELANDKDAPAVEFRKGQQCEHCNSIVRGDRCEGCGAPMTLT